VLRVYREPRRRQPLNTAELQKLIDETRREHDRRSPEEAASITAVAVSQWTAGTRSWRLVSAKGRSA